MFLFDDPFLDGWMGGPRGPDAPRYPRRAISPLSTLLIAGHSFAQTAYGEPVAGDSFGGLLQTDWPGTVLSDYVSYGSLQQIWDLDDDLRNSSFDAAIVTEFTADFANGFPALDTDTTRNTLQHLYWAGLTAQAEGAELILQDVWSPQGVDLRANVHAYFQFLREWLQNHLGQSVYIVPASPFVMALRSRYGDAIYDDGLHLGRGSRYARGMSYLVYSLLTQERCSFVRAGDEEIDQLAWDTLLTYECAGMGGTERYTATAGADPLPDPTPLGSGGQSRSATGG